MLCWLCLHVHTQDILGAVVYICSPHVCNGVDHDRPIILVVRDRKKSIGASLERLAFELDIMSEGDRRRFIRTDAPSLTEFLKLTEDDPTLNGRASVRNRDIS